MVINDYSLACQVWHRVIKDGGFPVMNILIEAIAVDTTSFGLPKRDNDLKMANIALKVRLCQEELSNV